MNLVLVLNLNIEFLFFYFYQLIMKFLEFVRTFLSELQNSAICHKNTKDYLIIVKVYTQKMVKF